MLYLEDCRCYNEKLILKKMYMESQKEKEYLPHQRVRKGLGSRMKDDLGNPEHLLVTENSRDKRVMRFLLSHKRTGFPARENL